MNFKKLTQLVSLIFMLWGFTIYSRAKSLRINHGPFIQYVTNNSVTINWTTSIDCISWVEYDVGEGSNFQKEENLYSVVDTCVDIFAKEIPLYIVHGNHETRGVKARNFDKYFHFPEK